MKTVKHDHDLFGMIVRNSFWSTFTGFAAPVITFLFGGLTIRYVGVEAFGLSTAVGSLLGIVGQFSSLGISEAAVPALAAAIGADDRRKVRRLVGIVVGIAVFSSCVTAAAILTFARPIVAWTKTSVPEDTALQYIAITSASIVISALTNAMMIVLRSASRYDLVTKATLPLSVLTGVIGCTLVPMFPSLLTVALIGCCSALLSLPIFFSLARGIVPETARPAFTLAELPSLARYGVWISLSRLVSVMTGGVDDLVIAAGCGVAALTPWTICKKAVGTVHSFLAQHVEHLIPTLGSLREKSRQTFDNVNAAIHWYVVVVAAISYTFVAWAGPALIAAVAGREVAALSDIGLLAVCLNGLAMSMVIIPMISAMAMSDAKPNFVLGLLNNVAVLSAVVILSRTLGAPAVYLAAAAVVPCTIVAVGISSTRLFDPALAWRRIGPVLAPLACGLIGILSTIAVPVAFPLAQKALVGAVAAPAMLVVILVAERSLGINAEAHRQLFRVIRHTIGAVGRIRGVFRNTRPQRAAD
jgi:O-antigen/teichoic acid export membrane protein